jgi:uncharacterized protein (TIGR02246 family)
MIVGTLLLVASFTSVAQDKQAVAEQEIRQIIAAQDEALSKGDVAKLKQLSTEDFTLVAPNGAISSKEQFLSGIENKRFVYEDHVTEDIKLRVFADMAVAQALLQMKIPFNGQRREVRVRATMIFVRVKDRWLLYTLHSSSIPPPRPPQPATPPATPKPPSE